jgi:hypothetical protein
MGGVVLYLHYFFTSLLTGGELAGERAPATHFIGGSVGPRAGLFYTVEKTNIS